MELILSKYTHFFISSGGYYLVYNSERNSFIKVSKPIFQYIKSLSEKRSLPSIEQSSLNFLLSHKIIIEKSSYDSFYNNQKLLNYLDRFNNSVLTLIIVPTTCCNFSCPYCIEKEKTNKTINNELINDLVFFINNNKNAKKINLTWYGGEPLVAFDKIEKILRRIKNDINIPILHHSIITNGYLFDKKICDFFKNYPLNDIQVTIDGDEDEHNSKRFTKKDNSTIEKILNNIDTILNELPSTKVFIRINIDENNKDSFIKLHEKLTSRWKGKNFFIYPGFIRIEDEKQTQMITPTIFGNSKRVFYSQLDKEEMQVGFYPRHKGKACSAVRINTFIIGPEGEIYKCWNDVSDRNKIIGYINTPKLTNPDLLAKFMVNGTLFDDPKCKECFFFPICGGGCPDYRLKNKYENGNYDLCAIRNDKRSDKQYLSYCLEKHYNILKRSNQIINM
jgi:uncharacterized protein